MHYRRLPLTGLCNARDLGGFPTSYGTATKYGVFLRSEVPAHITKEDMDYLKAYGIKMSMDFRGTSEIKRTPSLMETVDWAEYRHCPVFNEQVAMGADLGKPPPEPPGGPPGPDMWRRMYVSMAEDNKSWAKKALETAAEANGAVMFNCTTGKDRTGIFTALLLSIAGVAEADIIADYCVSKIYLKPMYLTMSHLLPVKPENGKVDLSNPFFQTDPENMETLLDYLKETYGGVVDYIRAIGVSDDVIDTIRERILE
jgi:protein-tyrosine phosphatase